MVCVREESWVEGASREKGRPNGLWLATEDVVEEISSAAVQGSHETDEPHTRKLQEMLVTAATDMARQEGKASRNEFIFLLRFTLAQMSPLALL